MTAHDLPVADGISWRPARPGDAAALADHNRKINAVEPLSFPTTTGFFEWLLSRDWLALSEDWMVAESDGVLVADCGALLHTSERGARSHVWAETAPGLERLRPGMLRWAVRRAEERLGGVPEHVPRVIRASVEAHRPGLCADVEAAGLGSPRGFAEMGRPITGLPAPRTLPDDITVVPWSDDLEDAAFHASNESFRDHWGALPWTRQEFIDEFRENPHFRPELSFLALDGSEVVSYCFCQVDEDDNAERGIRSLQVRRVGTMPTHRRMGLASHLIVRSMAAGAATGSFDEVRLYVDESSLTNATVVYERLGFETYSRTLEYTREL